MTAGQDPVLAALDQAERRCGDDPTRREAIAKVRADHLRDLAATQVDREQPQRITRLLRNRPPGLLAIWVGFTVVLGAILVVLALVVTR